MDGLETNPNCQISQIVDDLTYNVLLSEKSDKFRFL